ncbi:hypothetical protein AVEN_111450-1 [Araneus ventricosus]|uniref:Helitron helicase-like domain-containing protein n=1 Tax=Araneus ventricosus TaxID=182803 RepID=A0A4Y2K1K8_ARAVE|nr:hypothetical protein AVEN_111450-1 [Araneus ventricosus]
MQQNYQDAMAMVRKFGRPDLFVTFTCNPSWPEILNAMQGRERPENRPAIVGWFLWIGPCFNLFMQKRVSLDTLSKTYNNATLACLVLWTKIRQIMKGIHLAIRQEEVCKSSDTRKTGHISPT